MKRTLFLSACLLLLAGSGCAKTQPTSETVPEVTTIENVAAEPYTVKTIDGTLKGQDILTAITKNYKGKVVVIDFWATWCGPCRMAMKEVDKIKPELQKKGVVFVYVTGETSPEADWKAMLPNISGDHYRLSKEQWSDLCSTLKMPGIPSYMILNKDGSTAFSNVTQGGYPGNETVQNNAEVALSK